MVLVERKECCHVASKCQGCHHSDTTCSRIEPQLLHNSMSTTVLLQVTNSLLRIMLILNKSLSFYLFCKKKARELCLATFGKIRLIKNALLFLSVNFGFSFISTTHLGWAFENSFLVMFWKKSGAKPLMHKDTFVCSQIVIKTKTVKTTSQKKWLNIRPVLLTLICRWNNIIFWVKG